MPNPTGPSEEAVNPVLETAEQPPIDALGAVDAAFEDLANSVAEATNEMLDSLLEGIGAG
jgi:hypothetical protein